MVPEDGSVDGDDDVVVVHLLEEGRDAGGHHEAGAPRHALADVPDRRAVVVDDVVAQAEVGEGEAAAGEVAHLSGNSIEKNFDFSIASENLYVEFWLEIPYSN